MDDMHEATFVWPEIDPQDVILTGTFDQWSSSVHLTKTSRGFEGKVKLPWNARVLYKFIVDGRWSTVESLPEEMDLWGNVNNVYECPSKPESLTLEKPPVDLPLESKEEPEHGATSETSMPVSLAATIVEQSTSPEETSRVDQQATDSSALSAHKELPGETGSLSNQVHANDVTSIADEDQKEVDSTNNMNQITQNSPPAVISAQSASNTETADIAKAQAGNVPEVSSVKPVTKEAAVDDTSKVQTGETSGIERALGSSALAFVASNLGTAIHALTGVDPLHVDKIPVVTPIPTHDAFVVDPQPHPDSAAPLVSPPKLDAESGSKDATAANVVAESKGEESAVAVPENDVTSADSDPGSKDPESTAPPPMMTVVTSSSSDMELTDTVIKESVPAASPVVEPDPTPTLPVEPESTPAPTAEPEPTPAPSAEPEPTPAPPADPAPVPTAEPEPTPVSTTDLEPTHAPPAESEPTFISTTDPEPTPAPPAEPEPTPPVLGEPKPTLAPQPAEQFAPTTEIFEAKDTAIAYVTGSEISAATTGGPAVQPTLFEVKPITEAVAVVQSADPVSSKADKPANGLPKSETVDSMKSHRFPTHDTKATVSTTDTPGGSSQTGGTLKKRLSIFGKVKNMFHSDKGEKKERK